MITINDLSFAYGAKQILNNITISFKTPGIHGVIGLNGSGKTTFFNVLCGYEKPSQGTILFNNQTIKKADTALLETENYFYSKLTAGEFLNVFSTDNTSFNQENFARLFNLPLDELIENYSTGMKKKLILLSHLKQNKLVYVLDEPFNGLDLEANKALEIIIETLSQKGKIIFISSHIIAPLLHLCNEIHYLSNHTFVKSYTKNEFHLIEEEIFGNLKNNLKTNIDLAF